MSEKKLVLVICHNAAGQMYLGVLMNRIWFSPMLAGTPEEGIRLAQKNRFSLILLDGDVVDAGLQAAMRLLRSDDSLKDLPLIIFKTDDHTGMNQTLLHQGCSAVLTKPLDLSIVYEVLARLSGQPRTTTRITVKMRVHVEIAEQKSEMVMVSVNMSESGLFLRTLEPAPEGTRLRVKFMLPHDNESVELPAEVVRTLSLSTQLAGEPGMGLRFVEVPEHIRLKLRNFIQWEVTGDLEWNADI